MFFGLAGQFDVRPLPNLKSIINIILILGLISLLLLPPALALPRCYTGCTSNDVEVLGFSLMPSGTCAEGSTSADLYMHFRTNRVNTYCVYAVFDIYTDNNQLLEKDVSTVLGNFNTKVDLNLKVYTVSWPCGQSLYIRNIYVQWSQKFPCTNDCSGGTGSKCAQPGNTQVLIPGIEVVKVVDGLCESGTNFPITVTGPGYLASHTFDCSGGYFIFTNMAPGTYTVTETVPLGWTARGSPQMLTVYSSMVSTAVVTNTRDTGSLALTKQVQGQCVYGTIFPVSITGPGGYHSFYIFSCSGGTHTFTNLPTGNYTITEIVPEGWTASDLPQTVTVSKDQTAAATVVNTRDSGSLTVTKQVLGECTSITFEVLISGPAGYSASHIFDCSGGSYTFTDLPPGEYTITETAPQGWMALDLPQTVIVSKGETATATVTNLNAQTECQRAFAGEDAETCEGNLVVLEGHAIDATSVSWSIKTGLGTLEWPYDGSDYKAAYTPPHSGESEAVLTFTANGICPDVSDDVTIYVVTHPVAIITFVPA